MTSIAEMMERYARVGRIEGILCRPQRRVTPHSVLHARIEFEGLEGDHAPRGKRALTLIQAEHLPVIAATAGLKNVDPSILRRNILVSGLNLIAFRKKRMQIGNAVIEVTGPCPPCSRMEEVLGHGGYNAMRGHGGVYAEVITEGDIALGDLVKPLSSPPGSG